MIPNRRCICKFNMSIKRKYFYTEIFDISYNMFDKILHFFFTFKPCYRINKLQSLNLLYAFICAYYSFYSKDTFYSISRCYIPECHIIFSFQTHILHIVASFLYRKYEKMHLDAITNKTLFLVYK